MADSSPRRPLIAGNWKMNTDLADGRTLAGEILSGLGDLVTATGAGCGETFEIGFFPPATSLEAIAERVSDASGSGILVGAQNMHSEPSGAFTGEISASMIQSCGGDSVLLGHSERRHVFGETDELIGRKVRAAIDARLTPVLCVGETLEDRDAGRTTEVVGNQLHAGIAGLETASELAAVIIAYEPVWAIGTGRTASPEQAQEVHEFIRGELRKAFGTRGGAESAAEETRVLYGGSVKPDNAEGLLGKPDIDGALVGGASLKSDSFLGICQGAVAANR